MVELISRLSPESLGSGMGCTSGCGGHSTGWLARKVCWKQSARLPGKRADAAGTSPTGSEAERDLGTIAAAMQETVELLAREWPEDYPAGAVEWRGLESREP